MSNSLQPHGLYSPWNSLGQITGVGSLSLLQEILLTQGPKMGLPHCRWILYQLSHKGSPITLEWVAYPSSRRSSHPRNQIRSPALPGGFFTNRAIREAPDINEFLYYHFINLYLPYRNIYFQGQGTYKFILSPEPTIRSKFSHSVVSDSL